jgi:putative spermidine/putrescine transport system substrate-binding protein
MLWDAQVFDYDGWIIPAGLDGGPAEPRDALPALLLGHAAPRRPGQVHRLRPARASSQPLVSTHADLGIEMAPHMPTNPDNMTNYIVNDIGWWSDNQDEVEATFQNWLAQ